MSKFPYASDTIIIPDIIIKEDNPEILRYEFESDTLHANNFKNTVSDYLE
ncbi:MAG: hypothetical protein R2771_13990 [Saprospiraceae bacterium]